MLAKLQKRKEVKGRKRANIALDEIDTTILTREKLEEFCINLNEALAEEKRFSEYLKLDREKLTNMVAISKEQLYRVRHNNQTKEYQLQNYEEMRFRVAQENRKKLINLSSEKNVECLNLKLNGVRKVSDEQTCYEEREFEINEDITELKNQRSEMVFDVSEENKKQEIHHAENKHRQRQKDEKLHMLLEIRRDKIHNNKKKELDKVFEKHRKALENRKDREISQLLKSHAKSIVSLKHYYSQILRHNKSMSNVMKSNVQHMKERNAFLEKQLLQERNKNSELVQTINTLKTEQNELHLKMISSKRDQTELKITKLRLNKRNTILEHMNWEVEALNIKLNLQNVKISEEINNSMNSIFTLQTTAQELILKLEYVIEHLYHRISETNCTLSKIRNIYTKKQKWNSVLESVSADFINTSMDDINYQLATVAKDRCHVIRAYKQILEKYHINMDDTGFKPLTVDDILKVAENLKVVVNETNL